MNESIAQLRLRDLLPFKEAARDACVRARLGGPALHKVVGDAPNWADKDRRGVLPCHDLDVAFDVLPNKDGRLCALYEKFHDACARADAAWFDACNTLERNGKDLSSACVGELLLSDTWRKPANAYGSTAVKIVCETYEALSRYLEVALMAPAMAWAEQANTPTIQQASPFPEG